MKLIKIESNEPLQVSDNIEQLKAEGFKIAEAMGVETPVWHSNVVMGEKRLSENVNEWYLYTEDKMLLKITE